MYRFSRTSRSLSPARALGVGAAIALLGACDAQVSTEYTGQPLLTMTGSVELALNATRGALAPALAFLNDDRGEIQIVVVVVDAEGEFPAEFTLRVYEPPPASALRPAGDEESAAQLAVAFITAVTAAHPDAIQFAVSAEDSVRPNLCSGGPCECPAEGCQLSKTELCTRDRESCYTETLTWGCRSCCCGMPPMARWSRRSRATQTAAC